MAKQPPLTDKKRRWSQNRDVTLRGTRLNYNAGLQEKYVRELQRLVKVMTREVNYQVKKLFNSGTSESYFDEQKELGTVAQDASLSSQARILMNALTRKFSQLFDDKAKPFAERMINSMAKLSQSSLHASLKQLTGGLSLKTGVVPEGMEEVAKASIEENVSLIKSIPEQYFKDITGSVMRSITTGRGLADLAPELSKYEGQTERRAKNIALDQTRKAYNSINQQRMMKVGVTQFEWIHSQGGQHPRESHLKMDGMIFNFATLYEEQAAIGVPKDDRGIPGNAINCFLGDTKVSLANGCLNLWRYRHIGNIVTITLHNGDIIRSTLNHPILSLNGFLAINEINEGDYLIGCNSNNSRMINKEITGDKITFDDLFQSSQISFVNHPFPSSKFNFHGDIPKHNVDAIAIDNMLPTTSGIMDAENIEKFILSQADVIRDFIVSCFNSQIINTSNSSVMRYSLSIFNTELSHSKFCCTATVPQDYPVILQNTRDCFSSDFIKQGKGQDAFAILISGNNRDNIVINVIFLPNDRQDIIQSFLECITQMTSTTSIDFTKIPKSHTRFYSLNRILKKSISVFEGHVYTMESYNGWYSVSSTEIISKNCRCSMTPVIKFED